jgi:glycosyltransferase involved in cell wall biosynthesis
VQLVNLEVTMAVHTVASLAPDAGGPARTVPALCEHLQRLPQPVDVTLVVGSGAALADATRNGDGGIILHDHGQWLPINHSSARMARRRRVPRVVSPRGMLSPWARRHRWWKKVIAWHLYARRDLAQATVLHATSRLEADELRQLGVRQPIAVIPNGVDPAPPLAADAKRPERPYLLFLSRIHRKKGVAELLDAWRALALADWELVLAGPDEERLLTGADLPPGVRYAGSVDGAAKLQLMQQARVFVLPSYSENFGVVVAESLMAGVPVITTHGTPWESLASERCGWWIPMEPAALRATLREAIATPAAELAAMGARGRAFVERRFAWPEIAAQMAEVYRWALGGGARPACVETA